MKWHASGIPARRMSRFKTCQDSRLDPQGPLKELEEVLKREKFSKKLEGKEATVEKAVAKIALLATIIESEHHIDVIKEDPDDNRVLECAVAAQASLIVSGDSHLLKLKTYSGIDIISAAEFKKCLAVQEK